MPAINKLAQEAEAHGWAVFGLTSSGFSEVDEFKFQQQAAFEFLTCDDITLKTMVRSDPGVLLLNKGVVRGKWHTNDVPGFATAEKALK